MQYTVTHAIVGARVHTLMYVFNSVGGIQTGKNIISVVALCWTAHFFNRFFLSVFFIFIMKPQKLLHCPKSNPNFRDITWNVVENMILHELFRLVSRFPRYISCYIAENRFPLGQCTYNLWPLANLKKGFMWRYHPPRKKHLKGIVYCKTHCHC